MTTVVSNKTGITIGGVHSLSFEAYLKERDISEAEKRTVFINDIPGMDGYYDFTKVLGRDYYKDRTAKYTFRLWGHDNSERRSSFMQWLYSCTDMPIYDDFYDGWYLTGTCSDVSTEQDIYRRYYDMTATFTCQPFWISSLIVAHMDIQLSAGKTLSRTVTNDGMPAHPILVYDENQQTSTCTLTMNGITIDVDYSMNNTELDLEVLTGTTTIEAYSETGIGAQLKWADRRL